MQPNETATITVNYECSEPVISIENLKLQISGANPELGQDCSEYEIMAESCIPGIVTTDYKMIFEEQSTLKNLQMLEEDEEVMN